MKSKSSQKKRNENRRGSAAGVNIRQEIYGIILFFVVILTLVSFLSYHPADPSIHHSVSAKLPVHNLFGRIGAHLAGFFFGLFGLGALWIPVLILLGGIHCVRNHSSRIMAFVISGGFLLVISTAGLLAVFQDQYTLFGIRYSSGGMIGIPLKSLFVTYANFAGGIIILLLFLIIGFILATGLSLATLVTGGGHLIVRTARQLRQAAGRSIRGIQRGIQNGIRNSIRNGAEAFGRMRKRAQELPRQPEAASAEAAPEGMRKHSSGSPGKVSRPLPNVDAVPRNPLPEPSINIKPPVPRTATQADSDAFEPKPEMLKTIYAEEGFQLPPISFLNEPETGTGAVNQENLRMQAGLLEGKLEDFGIKGAVVEISPGPVITTFEYKPAPGVKISKIVNLTDDLALALSAMSIRIVAPIPGKDVVGIEIPNASRELVSLKEIVASKRFRQSPSKLTLCLGKDIVGNPVVAPMDKMPHLLIAGATGTGKSVGLNAMITSLLYKATPNEVKLLMVDPKRIELSAYDGIPHLISPVVTDMKKATNALFWAVKEMERRYEVLAEKKVRNIAQYNEKIAREKTDARDEPPQEVFPFIVIIIDELADLMMVASRDVEVALTRLAQMARAAGIHLILATQRPSVDVLTGVIKANFPTRMSFQVSSKTDSRTIIDSNGAENLLGNGDMLFVPPGTAKLQRIHGAFISEDELTRITDFLKAQQAPEYVEEVTQIKAGENDASGGGDEHDERYDEAVALVTKTGQASISMVQRHLRIGYNRAARIIEMMEQEGVVGPSDGVKAREVLVKSYDDMP